MIAHLVGTIAEKFVSSIIIDVAGVGYEVALTQPDFESVSVNETRKFYTYHSVRETAEELYGFSTLVGKKLFEMLTTVHGVGPKAAISILSLGSPEDIRNAIANADAKYLATAAGVGKKTAERIVLDLKDKVGAPTVYGRTADLSAQSTAATDEALDALMALGFSMKEATLALGKIDPSLPVSERVRLALRK